MQQLTYTARGYSKITIAIVAIIGLLAFNVGALFISPSAQAVNLVKVSDTLTDTDPGQVSNHTIQFITQSTITSSSTITIDFPDAFRSTSSPAFSQNDPDDYDIATSTADFTVYAAGGCTGGSTDFPEFEITSISSAQVFTFTHCNGSKPLDSATTTIEIGTHATNGATGDSQLVNPDTAGTQLITVTGPSADSGDTRVFIIDDVVLTAAVETTFTFTIAGVASAQAKCTETTDETSTATTLPFGTMAVGTAKVLAQDITVTTNARNGHVVTIQQNQNPLSSTGADIDVFDDGTAQTTPAAWTVPANTIDQENTYGHYGHTTEDSDLNGGEYTAGGQKYAGLDGLDTPDEIFSHAGPTDGTTADAGATSICYRMEIGSLQEAANDYTNEITYIATPTF